MRKLLLLAVVIVSAGLCIEVGAQSAPAASGGRCQKGPGIVCFRVEDGDRSGLPAPPPMPPAPKIAGLWETSNGHGGEAGMQIEVQTAPRDWPDLKPEEIDGMGVSICIYEPASTQQDLFNRNCFGYDDGGWEFASWNGQRLTVNFVPKVKTKDLPEIHVDLGWDKETETWMGNYERGDFQGDVILKRPGAKADAAVSPFVGTWYHESDMTKHPLPVKTIYTDSQGLAASRAENGCLHIAEDAEGRLHAREDTMTEAPRERIVVRGIAQPVPAPGGTYGTPVGIRQTSRSSIVIDRLAFAALNAGAVQEPPTLTLSSDGSTMTSTEPEFPATRDQTLTVTWTRVGGVSGRAFPQ